MNARWTTTTLALKHAALSIQTGPFGSQLHADDYSPGGRPVVNPVHLRDGRIQPDVDSAIDEETFDRIAQHELLPGDVVMGRRGELGRCGVVAPDQTGWVCGTGSIRVRPDTTKLESRWLRWLLSWPGTRDWLSLESVGTTMENLGAEVVGAMPITLPAVSTQRAIADYLDRETARLDALVSAKARVLGLLAEKRRALITRAVTRGLPAEAAAKAGLDFHAPLRDSGIPWLGEIPAHWEIKRLRHISPFITVGVVVNPSSYVTLDGVPFLYGSDVTEEGITLDSVRRVPLEVSCGELAKTCLSAGDIVTVRVGAPGITAVVPPELDGANCASIMLTRGAASFDSQWLAYAMNSSVGRHQVALVQYGAAQEQFNISHAVDFWFVVPPLSEQRQIVSYVDSSTIALDSLRAATTQTLDLLKERRAALIAAAVTGQIDVGSGQYYTDDAANEKEPGRRQ